MPTPTMPTPLIYLGTGGYSDPDLLGHLYPTDSKKSDYLSIYAQHYGAVEINSSFYAPIGQKAFAGMLDKSQGKLKFAVKLHQNFTHGHDLNQHVHADDVTATIEASIKTSIETNIGASIRALQPLIQADALAAVLVQFPHGFDRTLPNRQYLAKLTDWLADVPVVIEFRHASWHMPAVYESMRQRGLIWCSVDYPNVSGLPKSQLIFTARTGYLRLHGNNPNWWDAQSASERHDYRYNEEEMQIWARAIANQRQHFDQLYVFFQNTTNGYAVANIAMLRQELTALGFEVR